MTLLPTRARHKSVLCCSEEQKGVQRSILIWIEHTTMMASSGQLCLWCSNRGRWCRARAALLLCFELQ